MVDLEARENKLELLDTQEAASLLNITPQTIRKYIHDNKIKGVKIGRKYYIRIADLNKLFE